MAANVVLYVAMSTIEGRDEDLSAIRMNRIIDHRNGRRPNATED